MTILIKGFCLLVALFIFDRIKTLIRENASKLPAVKSEWRDGWKGKTLRAIMQTGYDKFSMASKSFRANDMYILPPSLFNEFRRIPNSAMNASAANEQVLRLARNLGPDYWDNVQFVRQEVIKALPSQIPVIQEEIQTHFSKAYTSPDGSWRSVTPWSTTFDMMVAFATRLLVGTTLCHDEEFLKKIGEFTRSVSIECILLRKLPSFMEPLIGPLLPARKRVKELSAMLRGPIMSCVQVGVDGNLEMRDKSEFPNDSLLPTFVAYVLPKYLPPHTPSDQLLTESILLPAVTGRLLGLCFAVIDTSTMTFTQTLFDLISKPASSYALPLKSEIQSVYSAHGNVWTPNALADLKHLDSFIQESQRLHPIGPALAARKCVSPTGWTFSNGDHIPHGAVVQLPLWPVHVDAANYSDPFEFQGFRFVDTPHPESMPSEKFLGFGHGNHACPGRRFAQMVIKMMVVEILTEYEYQELSQRPEDWDFGSGIVPNMTQIVMMRRKGDGEREKGILA